RAVTVKDEFPAELNGSSAKVCDKDATTCFASGTPFYAHFSSYTAGTNFPLGNISVGGSRDVVFMATVALDQRTGTNSLMTTANNKVTVGSDTIDPGPTANVSNKTVDIYTVPDSPVLSATQPG